MAIGLNTQLPVIQNLDDTTPVPRKASNYFTPPEVLAGISDPISPALSEKEIEQRLDSADNGVKTAAFLSQRATERTTAANEALSESKNRVYVPLDFKQAIKDFRDKVLTGLNDRDWEKIKAEVAKYLEENPGDTEGAMALKKALMKKLGFKGNLDEEMYIIDAMSARVAEDSQQQTIDEV